MKDMFFACIGIWRHLGCNAIGLQIECVSHDHLCRFDSLEPTEFKKAFTWMHFCRQNERLLVRHALDQAKGRRHYIHFSVTNKNVAVTAKAFYALVLVLIVMV
jgi:hypothetical protein